MISRAVAKRRIADGVRPSWVAAWLPFVGDLVIAAFCASLAVSLLDAFWDVRGQPFYLSVAVAFVAVVVPVAVIAGVSAYWADMSMKGPRE